MKNMITTVVIDTNNGLIITAHQSPKSASLHIDKYVKDNWEDDVPDQKYPKGETEKAHKVFFSQDDAPYLHIDMQVVQQLDEDATEVVTVPKWVFDSLKEHTETLEADVASGVQSGMYDDERNHNSLLDMEIATNFDPETFTASDYNEYQIKETFLYGKAREFMHDTCVSHDWSIDMMMMSLDEFLVEFKLRLTDREKEDGEIILNQFGTLQASQRPVLETEKDLQDHYGLEWVDYVDYVAKLPENPT